MQIGDWVLVASGRYWYLSYIDSFSEDNETVHVTKIARSENGQPIWIKPSPAICQLKYVAPLNITIPPEDYMEMHQLMIDLALQTGDKQWFEELTGGKIKWHIAEQ